MWLITCLPAFAGTTLVQGVIQLPAKVNPRNLFPNMVRQEPQPPGGSCGGNRPMKYPAVSPTTLNFDKIFTVNAVPLDPTQDHFRYPAKVNPNGSFSVIVPSNAFGYCIAANADKTRLVHCLPTGFTSGGTVKPTLNVRNSLLAMAQLVSAKPFSTPLSLDQNKLSQIVTNIEQDFEQRISGGIMMYNVATLLNALGFPLTPQWVREWTKEDKIPYALSTPDEVLSPTQINFNDPLEVNLLTSSYSDKVKFSVSSGSSGQLKKSLLGYATATFLRPRETLEMVFPSNTIRTVGLRIANGSGPGGSSIRRAFRFRAYDKLGTQVGIPLNWYTNQTGTSSFYGITVNSPSLATYSSDCRRPDGQGAYCERPIYRVTLEMSETVVDTENQYNALQAAGDPFYIDDINLSTQYSPMSNTMGWKPDGWELTNQFTPSPLGNFNHWLTNRDNITSPDPVNSCTWDNNWSGGNFWKASYPDNTPQGLVRKTLTSPAFTLSNLPINSNQTVNADTWLAASLSVPRDILWSRMVKTTATNSCASSYQNTMDPNDPLSWNDPLAPVEWTYINPRCLIVWESDCPVAPWTDWTSQGLWPQYDHWTHIHWQQYSAVERSKDGKVDALHFGTPTTRIYHQYSTDNGATWTEAYWNRDYDHRGRIGVWYHNHLHPFDDGHLQSYIDNYKYPWDSSSATPKRPCRNTDFWKSGWRKTQTAYKNGVYNYDFLKKDASGNWIVGFDGVGARDTNSTDWDGECREWDTEFYQDYNNATAVQNADQCCRTPSALSPADQAACTTVDANSCLIKGTGTKCTCSDDPIVMGTTVRYRFVFETSVGKNDIECYRDDQVKIPCTGVSIDDVAFSNDSLEGFFTDFQTFETQNLGSVQ